MSLICQESTAWTYGVKLTNCVGYAWSVWQAISIGNGSKAACLLSQGPGSLCFVVQYAHERVTWETIVNRPWHLSCMSGLGIRGASATVQVAATAQNAATHRLCLLASKCAVAKF